ncbi:MAG: hypothetical protein LAT67_05900 [Balneolales bacterium]|nr:hypothetical protein [Balneolales bacterium]
MAGGGGSAIVMLRLNFMTAIYLPILLYAMSTYELEQGALVISERNLDAVAVPVERSIFSGDTFEAQIFYRPVPPPPTMAGERAGGVESLANPIVRITEGPEGLFFDNETRRFVYNSERAFVGIPEDVFEREFTFRGVAILESVVEGEQFEKPFEQSFRVRRPNVQVISNAPQRLVRDSRNDLTFMVSGVPEGDITLTESSRNQTVRGNRLTWTPAGDTTTVTIFRRNAAGENVPIDTRGFSVVPPPPPALNVRRADGGGLIAPTEVVNPFNDMLELVISPDRQYFNDFPDDARYELAGVGLAFAIPGQATTTAEVPQSAIPFNRQRSQQLGEFVYGPFRLADLNNRITGQVNQVSIFVQDVNRVNFENRRIRQEDGFANNFALRTR